MFNSIISLGLFGLASAVPLTSRQLPNYPPSSSSTGFKLVVNVTDPAHDLSPSVNGLFLQAIHTGAGLNDAVLQVDGRIFYQNGTADEIRYNQGNILTDGGNPPFPSGIDVQNKDTTDADGKHEVAINGGAGTKGVSLALFPVPYTILTFIARGTFVACDQFVPYYKQNFITIRYAYDIINPLTSQFEHDIPQGCVAINLIPQCDVLPQLPVPAIASHQFAANVKCYPDVRAIDWTKYGP
ncbi:uncharacterized protein BCR38DRAFT_526865 [Pseudomassariella vexata]|uniref:DUF7907 domain-containing protein n=1 Tax=Pseudomassariella vexata TaxID=1141098 RepID=A0A1Y2DJW4_9PEZI|nr:uncharacterized protein BCR38DRAFT_526865 [Pseudomassariella vexata]ORY59543.1 hypothetical protein BCR38DRAFT_526865 [Pseudomassariella vexata]